MNDNDNEEKYYFYSCTGIDPTTNIRHFHCDVSREHPLHILRKSSLKELSESGSVKKEVLEKHFGKYGFPDLSFVYDFVSLVLISFREITAEEFSIISTHYLLIKKIEEEI